MHFVAGDLRGLVQVFAGGGAQASHQQVARDGPKQPPTIATADRLTTTSTTGLGCPLDNRARPFNEVSLAATNPQQRRPAAATLQPLAHDALPSTVSRLCPWASGIGRDRRNRRLPPTQVSDACTRAGRGNSRNHGVADTYPSFTQATTQSRVSVLAGRPPPKQNASLSSVGAKGAGKEVP